MDGSGRLGESAGYASGVFGAALATYTGVLVSNSAVPVWQEARRWMPPLFAASAVASAGAVLDLWQEAPEAEGIVAIFGTVGRIGELAAAPYGGEVRRPRALKLPRRCIEARRAQSGRRPKCSRRPASSCRSRPATRERSGAWRRCWPLPDRSACASPCTM